MSNTIQLRAAHAARGFLVAGLVAGILAPLPSVGLAQDDTQPAWVEEETEPTEGGGSILSVTRIEVTAFGGTQGGGTYLALPEIVDPMRTFDTAANLVRDFSGNPLPGSLSAPQKTIEGGPVAGAVTSFFLGPNFGMQLQGSYARTHASLTGFEASDPNKTRKEYDRTNVEILSGGGNISYNVGTERKMKIWPYVVLGFGGLLVKYPETDDVGALYFLYGGGVSFPIGGSLRARLGANFTLFSYHQTEVALDETVTFPAFTFGITWRHDVPVNVTPEGEEPAAAAPAAGG